MATKRDLVEAYSFSRRRLVTAFVSGAPGGREVEPSRPGRALIGGIALTVLVLAAGAVLGFFKPRPDAGWADSEGLIIAEDDAQLYLVQVGEGSDDTVLVPIVNTVSARLIVGEDLDPTTVPQEEIDKYPVVEGIGIIGAPVSTPGSSSLVESGWTACTADESGLRLNVASEPPADVLAEPTTFVRMGETYYLIAPGQPDPATGEPRYFRMAFSEADYDTVVDSLRGPVRTDVPVVPRSWLDLFPEAPGLSLDQFEVSGVGGVSAGLTVGGEQVAVGTLVDLGDEDAIAAADGYWPLTPFASAVYAAVTQVRGPVAIDPDASPGTRRGDIFPQEWPTQVGERLDDVTAQDVCAVLQAGGEARPRVVLGVRPTEDASADGLGPEEHDVVVELGHGSVVRAGSFASSTAQDAFLVDPQGVRYALPGDSLNRLGYRSSAASVVPSAWIEPFNCGVTLAREDALKTLSTERPDTCTDGAMDGVSGQSEPEGSSEGAAEGDG